MNRDLSAEIASSLEYAEDQCAARGVKFTEKRKQVLKGLLQSKKALSAYELTDYCRENYSSSLPAMSVYRILDFLEEVDLVHRLDSAQKYVACSHIACNHEHELSQFLICKSCYLVEEISIGKTLMNALKQSAEKVGFRLTNQELEFDSLCGNCSE
tara:strand:+ start:128 stop:595 length:468 start_codon:yes stop_codon:yes gene_type:complete